MQSLLLSVSILLSSLFWAQVAFANNDSTSVNQNSTDVNLYQKLFADKPERFEKTCTRLFKRLHHVENATAADGESLTLQALETKLVEAVANEPKLAGVQLNWNSADVDGNGLLTKEEFCNGLRTFMEQRKVSDFSEDVLTDEQKSKLKQFACQYVDKIPGVNLHETCDDKKEDTDASASTTDVAPLQKRHTELASLDQTSKNIYIAIISLTLGSVMFAVTGIVAAPLMPVAIVLFALAVLAQMSTWVLLVIFLVRTLGKKPSA